MSVAIVLLSGGLDSATALVREPTGTWRVAGAGAVTLYGAGVAGGAVGGEEVAVFAAPSVIETLST